MSGFAQQSTMVMETAGNNPPQTSLAASHAEDTVVRNAAM